MSTSINGARPGLATLVAILDLEPIEPDLFRSRRTGVAGRRLFGGEVAAQALVAAERTTGDDFGVHSLHAYFLRPGDAGHRIVYRVDSLQDGRSFRRRRVTAVQRGEPILCLDASFTTDRSRAGNHETPPAAPDPRDCPDAGETFPSGTPHPATMFDLRAVEDDREVLHPFLRDMLWFRLRGDGFDGRVSAAAVLTYVSDLSLVATVRRASGRDDVDHLTSLDHVLWFHNEVRFDDWLLYAKSSPAVGELRGLATGRIFHRDGTLIASAAQEGLLHTRR